MFKSGSGLEVFFFNASKPQVHYEHLEFPPHQSFPVCRSPSTDFPMTSSQFTRKFAFISSTVQPRGKAPASQWGNEAKGLATGHQKLEAKTRSLAHVLNIRKAKQLWGRRLFSTHSCVSQRRQPWKYVLTYL